MTNVLESIPEGASIALDTAPFIYYIEGGSDYDDAVVSIFEDCVSVGRNPASTSVITLAEVLTGTYKAQRKDLRERYQDILCGSQNLDLISITPELAQRAAELRSKHGLKLPDAFQLASALAAGAQFLVTNDAHFRRVTELTVLLLSDLTEEAAEA